MEIVCRHHPKVNMERVIADQYITQITQAFKQSLTVKCMYHFKYICKNNAIQHSSPPIKSSICEALTTSTGVGTVCHKFLLKKR